MLGGLLRDCEIFANLRLELYPSLLTFGIQMEFPLAQMAVWLGPGVRELSSGKEASRGSSTRSRGGVILASG